MVIQMQKEKNAIKRFSCFIFIIFIFNSCAIAQVLSKEEKEQLGYSVINYHYTNYELGLSKDKKKIYGNLKNLLYYKTSNPYNDFTTNNMIKEGFYETISYLHGDALIPSKELDALFSESEKTRINQEFSNLNREINLNEKKLRANLLFYDENIYTNKSYETNFVEKITFPIFINSNKSIYSFFVAHLSNNSGGAVFIYKKEGDNWKLKYRIQLYYD